MKNVITGQEVDIAFESGKKEIVVGSQDIITGIAKEKAEKYGIRFVTQEDIPSPEYSLTTTAPVVPTPSSPLTPPFDIEYWRKQFPLLKTHFHVANCSHSPQSTFTK